MKAALAARVAAALGAHIFDDVEIRAPNDGAWRTTKARRRIGGQEQSFDGMEMKLVTAADRVEFLQADWPVNARPGDGWLVRFSDGAVFKITEPAKAKDGLAITAPVVAHKGAVPA